ncbi:peptidoglycan synthetase [Malaciobacter canalis]|uniref:Peptidoglycan synthetase n=2 Tax=Malaciobacter TaxID=2321114 RepID=A0ABX4LMH0_9BACT|nr:peptidoglycan synthetase [Malaciobacter canalis]PHO08868.1 peptidoglycan synthetase [Malaciobacter canalis]QEE32896.1 hypothetical protein ACAN_1420 [Malaciobacter canalis]
MKVSSIIDIVDGETLNSPSISFIYNIKLEALKVKEGDLFVAKNLDDINLAIENGAFLILVDSNVKVTDFEIAWIKVNNLDEALIKLIRFKLSNYDLYAYNCKKTIFNFIHCLKNSHNTQIKLIKNIDDALKILDYIEDKDKLIFCNNKLMNNLYPKNQQIPFVKKEDIKNIIKHTIFETSFTYKDIYFQKIKVSTLYIEELLSAWEFLNDEVDFSKLKNSTLLRPLFVDKFINQTEFGKSNKFLIVQEDSDFIEEEINYLKTNYKFGIKLFITNKYINNFFAKQIILEDIYKVKDYLKENQFNAAYLIGYKYEDVFEIINQKQMQTTLAF